ncbi:cutinase transcription factor 1 beta [Fusarium austroafricanum]|uniref:Cutinase transcription factor 1 beta n=1 Tax=Fusarium austroafricanum TaxID=2364996 RepID=A0A8H4KL47_9HYPO|nr:cutinase transcription factor 1 beta [Fusarium austroafricanum]
MTHESARIITHQQIEEIIDHDSEQNQQEQEQYCSIDMQGPNTASSTDKSPVNAEQGPIQSFQPLFRGHHFLILDMSPFCNLKASFCYLRSQYNSNLLDPLLSCVGCIDGSGGQLSLVPYSAILFAGSTHVDQAVVCAYGYSDRKLLRKELYKRAQLIFDLDMNQDKLVGVQTALLLTCRGVSDDEVKDSWLWWCCSVRDNILSLGMNRPSRIKDHDFNVPMLEVADLESDLLTKKHSLPQRGSIGPLDKTQELESAELCVQKTRLSVPINQILELQAEAEVGHDEGAPEPINTASHLKRVHAVDASLRSWKKALPRSCSYRPVASRSGEVGRTPVDVRRHLLRMVYYTALYTLHRPQFLPNSPRQLVPVRNPSQAQQMSKTIVLDSTNDITRLAAELHQHNMDCNLPIAAITVIFPAISMHMLNMKSQSKTLRDMAVGDFLICMRILEKMQKLCSAVEATVGFLETLLSQASLTGVVGLNLDQRSQHGQQGQADAMAILQALTTQNSQTMHR